MDGVDVGLIDVKNKLKNYIESVPEFRIIHVSEICYAVKTGPTNMSSLDYVHVTRKGHPPSFVCAFGSRCDRVGVMVAKKTRTFSCCPHEHFANIIDPIANNQDNELHSSQSAAEQVSVPGVSKDNPWLNNTSQYRFHHQKIKLKESEMKKIESEILRLNKSDGGFPALYQVKKFQP